MSHYIIRAQGLGFLTDCIFDGPPPADVMHKVLDAELSAFGIDPKTGEPRERWVRAVPVEVAAGDLNGPAVVSRAASPEQIAELRAAKAEVGQAKSATPELIGNGVGTVTNPGA
jgi:hypothetical protein